MAAIREDYGSGGSGLTGVGSQLHPKLATVLRDIADDLDAIATGATDGVAVAEADPTAITGADPTTVAAADPAAVTEAALGAFTDPPSAGEMAALRALVNELRTTVIANRTLGLDLKARAAEERTLLLDLKARAGEVRTLIVAIKSKIVAGTLAVIATLKTTKA